MGDENKKEQEGKKGVEEEKKATGKTEKGGGIKADQIKAILKNMVVEIQSPMASSESWVEYINAEIDKL